MRFRWLAGADSSMDGAAWYLDEISVYTCIPPVPSHPPANLTASDGVLTASDEVTIAVNEDSGQATTVEVRVAAGLDDAEESSSGSVGLTSSDLELVYTGGNQTVGIRFNGLDIPQGDTGREDPTP